MNLIGYLLFAAAVLAMIYVGAILLSAQYLGLLPWLLGVDA